MKRTDLQHLARLRRREASALLRAGHAAGAYYLSGYVVECALKACIARKTERFEFPEKQRVLDSYTHDLNDLLETADLKTAFDAAVRAQPALGLNWGSSGNWVGR